MLESALSPLLNRHKIDIQVYRFASNFWHSLSCNKSKVKCRIRYQCVQNQTELGGFQVRPAPCQTSTFAADFKSMILTIMNQSYTVSRFYSCSSKKEKSRKRFPNYLLNCLNKPSFLLLIGGTMRPRCTSFFTYF